MSRLERLREALASARTMSAATVYEMEIVHLLAVARLVARAHAAGLTLADRAEGKT